jgi:hypothetical protein
MKNWIVAGFIATALLVGGDEKVGGSRTFTVDIGTGFERMPEPGNAGVLLIQSVRFAGAEVYAWAARDVVRMLDSLGTTVYGCSELKLADGLRWPTYQVRIAYDASGADPRDVCSAFADGPLAGLAPSAEPPEQFGAFFLKGSCETWWYGD